MRPELDDANRLRADNLLGDGLEERVGDQIDEALVCGQRVLLFVAAGPAGVRRDEPVKRGLRGIQLLLAQALRVAISGAQPASMC